MDSTSRVLVQTQVSLPPPVLNMYESLEDETREKLLEFERDPHLNKMAFEPLPRDHRAVM
ncbi:hypothetical protein EON65_22185 [archaeon]|nr:MAG: hypothetical protein EON65_22185 [archaeon]